METIDLSKPKEEFVFHFGGEFNRIRAETFADAMLEFTAALKEINKIVNPEHEIEIYIDALGKGSFRAQVKTMMRAAVPLVARRARPITTGLLILFIWEKVNGNEPANQINIHGDVYIVENSDEKFMLPQEAETYHEQVKKSPEVENRVSRAFEKMNKDEDVSSFGIAESLESEKPIIHFPRSEFPDMSEMREVIMQPDENTRWIEEKADLRIIKAIFEESPRKWEFVWRGDTKISAPIVDEDFYAGLANRTYVIGAGDKLQVMLGILQHRDEMNDVWINQAFRVNKVLGHTPGPERPSMFKDGEGK